MQDRFLFEGTGNDQVDIVVRDFAHDSLGRITVSVMNRRIVRQLQTIKNRAELFRRLVSLLADVNQTQSRTETIPNSLRFGQNLFEAWRKCAGHRDLLVSGWIRHQAGQQSSAFALHSANGWLKDV